MILVGGVFSGEVHTHVHNNVLNTLVHLFDLTICSRSFETYDKEKPVCGIATV